MATTATPNRLTPRTRIPMRERNRRTKAVGPASTAGARIPRSVGSEPASLGASRPSSLPPLEEIAIVAAVPGEPPDADQRVRVVLDPDDPTKSVAIVPEASNDPAMQPFRTDGRYRSAAPTHRHWARRQPHAPSVPARARHARLGAAARPAPRGRTNVDSACRSDLTSGVSDRMSDSSEELSIHEHSG